MILAIIRGGWKSAGNERRGDTRGRETRNVREGVRKYMRMKKKGERERETGRTYPLIQDLFNYGPSPGLSRGRF